MKILYCITSSSWGGAQLHVFELCKDQIKRGNEVTLVVGNKGELFNKVQTIPQVKLILLNSLHREISPFNDIKTIFALRKIIKMERPDIVHLHSSKAGVLGRIANHNLAPKTIFTVHGWAFTDGVKSKLKKKIYRLVEKAVRKYTDLFICVSKYDEKIGKRDGVLNANTNSLVIHNGSPYPLAKDINFSIHKPIRFVMVARFSPQKDQETLIKAISQLPRNKYHLTFVGGGETLATCKKLVNNFGINKNVNFAGFQRKVDPYLINNDVYILSTHYEGLPIGIIEAMSYGLPVIATDVGGNSELVLNNKNGYLVNTVEELTMALKRVIKNPEKVSIMGKESRKLYLQGYTLKNQLAKINSCYLKLLQNK